mgnify:FL=1
MNGAAGTGLLDFYGGAGLAYSFRKLRSGYSGSSIRARESSGNTEQDIGFVDGVLDTSSLLTFTGANDGLTPIIYDQSGNGVNLVQTTAGNQLEIVDAGSLVTSNSLAATQGSSSRGGGTPSVIAFSGMSEFWFFDVIDVTNTSSTQVLYESSTNLANAGAFLIYLSGGNLKIANRISGVNVTNDYIITSGRKIISIRLIAGVDRTLFSEVYINGVEISISSSSGSGTSSFTNQGLYVGARAGTAIGFLGKRQESIFYPSDQSANRVGIETNINNYHGIY